MKIKILYFAQLRDIFGCDEEERDVREHISVGEVDELLRSKAGAGNLQGVVLKKAVNEEWADDQHILNPNDVLVLLPPVSGG